MLTIRGLTVELPTAAGWVRPVNDVSLRVRSGEALGIVGESGSGKTMLALALMGLLPPGARTSGKATLGEVQEPENVNELKELKDIKKVKDRVRAGLNLCPIGGTKNLMELSEAEWREVRGRAIAMVFQEPMTALNPVMRVEAQIEEAIRTHYPKMATGQVRHCMLQSLRLASVPEPETRANQYPHQLSGGLRQRVMIAMAIAAGISDPAFETSSLEDGAAQERCAAVPRLLIADEPTTALDVTVQKQILELLGRLRRDLGLGLLFITHDLGVVPQVAERIAVMYAGRIVEEGPVGEVLRAPRHPYMQGLLAASPGLKRGKLTPIPGTVPQLTALPPGCAFEPRCGVRQAECSRGMPELRAASANHEARCILI